MNGSMKTSNDFDVTPKAIFSKAELKYTSGLDPSKSFPDAFLTPLLYNYHALDGTEENPRVVAVGDMPMIV